MLDHPEYDRLVLDFRSRFDESPWSPELLEERVLFGEEEKPAMPIKHAIALLTPTELLPVVVVE